MLKQFVATVQSKLNHEDMVCRYGGEEFALIAPNTTANQAKLLMDEIREQFNEILFQAGDRQFQVTFSAGITEIGSRNNQADKLVAEADQALYSGKNSGRNKTVIYSEDVSEGRSDTRLNVIIVDDDPLIREIVINRFNQWQPSYEALISVHAYSDGASFLSSNWYRKGEKYIVLLDGYMPELDGLDVLRNVRENYSEQHILVVMLTARNNTSDIVKALQLGADDYVGKPFLMQELVLRLERLANRIFG
ncbi:Transcriptional regulatory protein CseB [compost metagenome]